MSTELNSVNTKQEIEFNAEKRAFMKKFGKYSAVGVGMATLMTPTISSANMYNHTCHDSHAARRRARRLRRRARRLLRRANRLTHP